ncbi:MAG TPA: hypothetical protein VIK87_11550 [Sphingomonadales bacterium]
MSDRDLEEVFDKIAEAIDEAGPKRETLFLAKLALTLAHRLRDPGAVDAAITAALADLEPD